MGEEKSNPSIMFLLSTLKLVIDHLPPWVKPNKQLQAGMKHILKSKQAHTSVPPRTQRNFHYFETGFETVLCLSTWTLLLSISERFFVTFLLWARSWYKKELFLFWCESLPLRTAMWKYTALYPGNCIWPACWKAKQKHHCAFWSDITISCNRLATVTLDLGFC